jgi:hypothetical protein
MYFTLSELVVALVQKSARSLSVSFFNEIAAASAALLVKPWPLKISLIASPIAAPFICEENEIEQY